MPLAVGNMAQPEDVRRGDIMENIICVAITYHCMEYNQRLKDDLENQADRSSA